MPAVGKRKNDARESWTDPREPPVVHGRARLERADALAAVCLQRTGRDLNDRSGRSGDRFPPHFRRRPPGNAVRPAAYFMVDKPVRVEVAFHLKRRRREHAPHRAVRGQAIRAQLGRPLTCGAGRALRHSPGLVGRVARAEVELDRRALQPHPDGGLLARLSVELGPKPWFVNFKPHYYRAHLATVTTVLGRAAQPKGGLRLVLVGSLSPRRDRAKRPGRGEPGSPNRWVLTAWSTSSSTTVSRKCPFRPTPRPRSPKSLAGNHSQFPSAMRSGMQGSAQAGNGARRLDKLLAL